MTYVLPFLKASVMLLIGSGHKDVAQAIVEGMLMHTWDEEGKDKLVQEWAAEIMLKECGVDPNELASEWEGNEAELPYFIQAIHAAVPPAEAPPVTEEPPAAPESAPEVLAEEPPAAPAAPAPETTETEAEEPPAAPAAC